MQREGDRREITGVTWFRAAKARKSCLSCRIQCWRECECTFWSNYASFNGTLPRCAALNHSTDIIPGESMKTSALTLSLILVIAMPVLAQQLAADYSRPEQDTPGT